MFLSLINIMQYQKKQTGETVSSLLWLIFKMHKHMWIKTFYDGACIKNNPLPRISATEMEKKSVLLSL